MCILALRPRPQITSNRPGWKDSGNSLIESTLLRLKLEGGDEDGALDVGCFKPAWASLVLLLNMILWGWCLVVMIRLPSWMLAVGDDEEANVSLEVNRSRSPGVW